MTYHCTMQCYFYPSLLSFLYYLYKKMSIDHHGCCLTLTWHDKAAEIYLSKQTIIATYSIYMEETLVNSDSEILGEIYFGEIPKTGVYYNYTVC